MIGEGTEDLIGFNGGGWYVGVAEDGSFTTSAWAGWSDGDWDALRQGDFNGDGRTDVLGLLDGMWFVGISDGTSFTTTLRSQWSNVDWQNVLIADLDRDGNDDILARNGGNWWASLSNGTTFDAATLWASWADLPWDRFRHRHGGLERPLPWHADSLRLHRRRMVGRSSQHDERWLHRSQRNGPRCRTLNTTP